MQTLRYLLLCVTSNFLCINVYVILCIYVQKQPPEVFCEKVVLRKVVSIIFVKHSITDAWQEPEYASGHNNPN